MGVFPFCVYVHVLSKHFRVCWDVACPGVPTTVYLMGEEVCGFYVYPCVLVYLVRTVCAPPPLVSKCVCACVCVCVFCGYPCESVYVCVMIFCPWASLCIESLPAALWL